MDGLLLPILMASVSALLAYGVLCFVQGFRSGDRKKLAARLSDNGTPDAAATARHSITLQMEATGLPPALANNPIMQALQKRLIQAFPKFALIHFLAIAAGIAVVFFVVVWAVGNSIFMGVVAGLAGAYLPFFYINSRRVKRQRALAEQLPEALDFLSRILRAGHSLTTGLQMMGDELPSPIGIEFRQCYDQHSLGQPLEDCLKDMTNRIQSTDFAFFVTAILIQRQTGGDLSEVLTNISSMIRQRIRLQQHVKAKTAEGRFTGYILVAFPALMFMVAWVMNPAYAGILLHTTTGMELLGTAFGLQVMGLWAIRKITAVKV